MKRWIWLMTLCLLVAGLLEIHTMAQEKAESERIIEANEQLAISGLRTLVSTEATWRQMDAEGNDRQDFWTYDISCFYRMLQAGGQKAMMIDLSLAQADASPAGPEVFGNKIFTPRGGWKTQPKSGYLYKVLKLDEHGNPYNQNKVGNTPAANDWRFGFCAFPAEYGVTGKRTFIINQAGMTYACDLGPPPEPAGRLEFKLEADPLIVERYEKKFPQHPEGYLWYEKELAGEPKSPLRVLVKETPLLTNEHIAKAEVQFDSTQGLMVNLQFNDIGKNLLADITSKYADAITGENRRLAIILDNKLVSAPVIRVPITDGAAVIIGLTEQQALNLANALASSKLNVSVQVKPTAELEKKIEKLIKQLGAEDWQQRESATKELEKIGNLAKPQLSRAKKESPDAEIRFRAETILQHIATLESAAGIKGGIDQWPSEDPATIGWEIVE